MGSIKAERENGSMRMVLQYCGAGSLEAGGCERHEAPFSASRFLAPAEAPLRAVLPLDKLFFKRLHQDEQALADLVVGVAQCYSNRSVRDSRGVTCFGYNASALLNAIRELRRADASLPGYAPFASLSPEGSVAASPATHSIDLAPLGIFGLVRAHCETPSIADNESAACSIGVDESLMRRN
jgi:hypothetical protein